MPTMPNFMTVFRVAIAVAFFAPHCAMAQPDTEPAARPEATPGPAVPGFGPTYAVPEPDFATPGDHTYRMVLDVAKTPDAPGTRNPRIETAARFLNMHVRAGVLRENLHVAVVLHGSAGKAALTDAAYQARFGTANPDRALLEALDAAGVEIYLCGQTAAHRGFARGDLAPAVDLALSAMTVLVALQAEGYQLVVF